MTIEDTFKSIVLSTATTTASLPDDQGVKTRGMKKQSLMPMKKTISNDKHNPKTHSNATGKRALAQINEDNDIAQPESATPSHKKQKMSPTDTTTTSRDSTMISVDTPESKISTSATTSPAETSNADTSKHQQTRSPSNTSPAETLNASNHQTTTSSSNATPAETSNAGTSGHQNTKSLSKVAARTKCEIQRKRAMDRARRAETRAKEAETLLMSAHNRSPERLKLGVLRFFNEQLASKNDQIEILGQQVEEREIEIAQQKGRIRSHVDWEKTYKANLAEVKEELKTESALVMEYLKIIIQRDGNIYEQDKTIQKLQAELDELRTVVAQKDETIQNMQAEQKSVKGALETIWGC